MKKYIEKYFLLLIFIFAISLVNITSTFSLGKKDTVVNKLISKGKVDLEACKRNATKTGIDQYSATCRTQCTSTDPKYAQFKKDNKVACDVLSAADRSDASGTQKEKQKEETKDIEDPSLTEDYIKNADLSTKEAFDKIKEVFTVKAEKLGTWVVSLGLVHVRVTIAPKAVASDPTKTARALYDKRLEQLQKVFNQRIIALAEKAPTNLGATLHTAPAEGSLYELIYKGAVDGLILTDIEHVSTNLLGIANPSITYEPSNDGDIINAKVIAVRKPLKDASAIDILLQLDGAPGYVSRFEKLSGVKVSYAHIANPAAQRADFVAKENFKDGLAPGTEASTSCDAAKPPVFTEFVPKLTNNPVCKNLLKITVDSATTAEFGIPDGVVLDPKDRTDPNSHRNAAAARKNDPSTSISFIFKTFLSIRDLTGYFNPNLGETEDHYFYASDAIRNLLKSSRYIKDFAPRHSISYNWPPSEYVQAALATISSRTGASSTSLFRVAGDPKSVYFTKYIWVDF